MKKAEVGSWVIALITSVLAFSSSAANLSELLLSARARDPAYAIAKAQADAAK